jgi:hypothetical protein
VSRLAGPDAEADREVGLPGARRSEEDDVLPRRDEVERPEVGDDLTPERSLVVEVELLDRLSGGKARRTDPDLASI